MAQAEPVFVKVLGFSDPERHALNTLFRLSESAAVRYLLWTPDAPQLPRLALVDGDGGPGVLAELGGEGLKLIWIGSQPPADAVRVFNRPLLWPDVLQAMDAEVATDDPVATDIDFDLDLAGPDDAETIDTQPIPPEIAPPRVLVAGGSREARLYLRAKLALSGLTQVDEAETGPQALTLATQAYDLMLVDWELSGGGWPLVRSLRQAQPDTRLICLKRGVTLLDRLRARRAAVQSLMTNPPHPGQFQQILQTQ